MKKLLFSLFTFGLFSCFQLNAQINTFPLVENFDAEPSCGTSCTSVCNLTNGWTNETTDDKDWATDAGGTGSNGTGPSGDHTTGAGNYLYTEATSCFNQTANLISPALDLTGVPNMFLEFWYHMYATTASDMGNMFVDVTTDSGATWVQLDSIRDVIDLWQLRQVNLSAYVGDTIQVRFRGETGTGFRSDMAIDDITFKSIFLEDAGITSINMTNPATIGANLLPVTIKNFGTNTLTSANINFSVNGVPQASTFPGWTGSLAFDSSEVVPSIGGFVVSPGITTIKAWSSLPNGIADPDNSQDTAKIILCTALSGTYTLGGTGADFSSFDDLGFVLTSCGVSASTTINVNPGTYTGRLILDHVPGVSSTNTLTIDGGDASLVTLSNSTFSNVYLNGTDWTTIKNITLENTGTNDAYGVQLRDSASNNTIDSCVINMTTSTGATDVVGVNASDLETVDTQEGLNAYWTTVSNCFIKGGERGISFDGATGTRNIGNSFINNVLDSCEDFGILVDDQDSIQIIGNTVSNLRNSQADGIFCTDLMMFNISYNSLLNVPDVGFAILDGNFDATPTSRGQIINNMISSQTDNALDLDDIEETDVWHNTIYSEGADGAIQLNDIVGLDIRNNIFVSTVSFAFESADAFTTTSGVLENNLYWTPASNSNFVDDGPTVHADLTSWQAALATANTASIEADPIFVGGLNDLHVLSAGINDLGDNAVGVMDDIDGDSRPAGVNVDMGADEFTPLLLNAAFNEYTSPESGCGDSITDITVVVTNLGANDITAMSIDVDVTGDLTQSISFNYTNTLAFGVSDTVTVGSINTYGGGTFNLTGYVTLTGDQDLSNDTLLMSFSTDPFEPQGIDAIACDADTAILTALNVPGASYNWYDAATAGTLVGTGNSFVVPSVLAQSTYFLEYITGGGSLTTAFAGGNGSNGNMFDVVAINDIPVQSFECNLDPGTHTMNIYYKVGTHVGFETDPASWTLVGTASVVSTSNGVGTLVPISFGGLTIPAGQTYAFYVQTDFGIDYTNGGTVGNVLSSNADLQILEGSGKGNPLFTGSTFTTRNWNGTINYGFQGCSNIRTSVTATLDTSATASFTASPTGNVVSFDASATTHADSLSWDFGDGTTGTGVTPTNTYAVDSTYVVCLTAFSPCNTDVICDTMDICATLTGDFTSVITNNFDVDFTDVSTGTPVSWTWDFGNGTTSSMQTPATQTYMNADSIYLVSLTVVNFCGDTSVFTDSLTIMAVGINELDFGTTISVSPNPSNGEFVLNLTNYVKNDLNIDVLDQLGKVVYKESLTENNQGNRHVIDLKNYPNGIYFLRLSSTEGVATKKIIVQH